MIKYLNFFSLLLIIINGCNNESDVKDLAFDQQIYIHNPDNMNEISLLSDFVENVEIITLEFSDSIIINEIKKVRIFNDKIFIQDDANVFVFDMQGKIINKISMLGKGPGEYYRISDFDIDKKTGHIFIFDNMSQKLIEYDYKGTLINELQNKLTGYTFAVKYDLFYTYMSGADTKSSYCLNIYNKKGEVVERYFKGKTYETNLGNRTILSGTHFDDLIPFHQDFDYNIYLLKEKKIRPHIKINFGKHQISKSLKKEILLNPEDSWKILIDNDAILGINNVHILHDYTYFEYVYNMLEHKVIYSEKSNKVYRNIVDDITGLYFQKPICQYKDKFISIYPTMSIPDNIKFIKQKINKGESISNRSIEILNLLESIDLSQSNPIVLLYTMK